MKRVKREIKKSENENVPKNKVLYDYVQYDKIRLTQFRIKIYNYNLKI